MDDEDERLSIGEFIALGFHGVLLIIATCLFFTGIGSIPGILLVRCALMGLFRGGRFSGEFIGIAPLIVSTLVVGTALIFILMAVLASL